MSLSLQIDSLNFPVLHLLQPDILLVVNLSCDGEEAGTATSIGAWAGPKAMASGPKKLSKCSSPTRSLLHVGRYSVGVLAGQCDLLFP